MMAKTAVLQIHSKRPSFRRAGMQFGSEPVIVPVKSLKPEQIEALKAEPNLVVVEGEADVKDK
jgi:hypothetical protein